MVHIQGVLDPILRMDVAQAKNMTAQTSIDEAQMTDHCRTNRIVFYFLSIYEGLLLPGWSGGVAKSKKIIQPASTNEYHFPTNRTIFNFCCE